MKHVNLIQIAEYETNEIETFQLQIPFVHRFTNFSDFLDPRVPADLMSRNVLEKLSKSSKDVDERSMHIWAENIDEISIV